MKNIYRLGPCDCCPASLSFPPWPAIVYRNGEKLIVCEDCAAKIKAERVTFPLCHALVGPGNEVPV